VRLFDRGNKLECSAKIKNNNSQDGNDLQMQVCFHTYFSVHSIKTTQIKGLSDIVYVDKVRSGAEDKETRDIISIGEEVDRIYKNVPGDVLLTDSSVEKALAISKHNMEDIVLWNPWVEKAKNMSDLPDDGFHSFVCIETGQIANPVCLAPQASTEVKQVLHAHAHPNKL